MKVLLILLLFPVASFAASGTGPAGYKYYGDPTDIPTLRRGLDLVMKNCLGCHDLSYMRMNRIAEDLGFSDADALTERYQPYMTANDKYADIHAKASQDMVESSLGARAPELSLMTRAKGPKYVLNYLLGFYYDSDTKEWNNAYLPGASMPPALYAYQGVQTPVYDEAGHVIALEEDKAKRKLAYNTASDITAFLEYTAEPGRMVRLRNGWWVLLFIALLTLVSYFLYKNYWRDVH